jgi:nucleotide-binding universal stress UspA family protein
MTLPRNILVPIDLGDHTAQVLDYAVALAGKLDAKVHLLHVVSWPLLGAEVPVSLTDAAMNEVIARARQELDHLAAAHAGKVPFGSVELETGDARSGITAAAERLGADLIVMGTHGRRGVSRMLLGSVAERIVRTAPCPVLLVRFGTADAP